MFPLLLPASGILDGGAGAADLVARLATDLTCVALLTRGIYYRYYQRSDLFLTFFAFNLVIFLIAFMLNRVEMTMGAAFGLFAVFSMLRYRTEDISAKDMTYMFLVIALGLLMAISGGGWVERTWIGGIILVATALLEGNWIAPRELALEMSYDSATLVHADVRDQLMADLRTRTGLDVRRVDVRQIDLMRDAAKITVYYHASRSASA